VIIYPKAYATHRQPAALSAYPIGKDMLMATATNTGPAPEEYLERWTPEWRVLTVMAYSDRSRDWVAVLVDVEPEEFQSSWNPRARVRYFRIPGKHRSRETAWCAFEDLIATRH
jgi:hypothetical protein